MIFGHWKNALYHLQLSHSITLAMITTLVIDILRIEYPCVPSKESHYTVLAELFRESRLQVAVALVQAW